MPDYSDLLAGNPYFQPKPRDNLSTLGSMLANMGAGIAGAGASGQPWMAGIAPGAAMASNAVAKQKEQDELEEARRFQMGLHLQQLKQLQDDRDLKNAGIAALVKNNPGGTATPEAATAAATPGLNVQPNPVQLGPRAAPTGPQGNAISKIEGDYSSIGPVADAKGSRGYGKYQVMDYNVGPWTKEALGQEMTPQQFLQNPQAQDTVFNNKFGQYQKKYGPVGAAKAWFAGEKGMNNPNATDVNGMSVRRYGDTFAANGGAAAAPGGAGPTFASLPPFEGAGMPDPAMQPGALPPGVEPKLNLPPALAAPSASPVLPPFQIPGMPTGPTPPAAPSSPLQPAIAQGGSDVAPTPQVIPAQYTPPPAMPAPGPPPQIPRPTQLPASEANVLNNMLMTRAITPEQFLAQKNKRLDEIHHDQQSAATEAWKQQNENYRFNRGLAEKADTYRPLTAPEARQLGLPENVQYQLNTKTNKVEPMTNTKQPRFEDVKDSAGRVIAQRNVDTNQLHPINQNNTSDFAVPKDLKGEDVYQALADAGQVGKANEIRSIVEGDSPIPPPTARTAGAQATRDLVFQAAGPGFTDALHAERLKMKTEMNKGKIGTALRAQGTLFNHLNEGLNIADDLNNSPYPPANKALNALGVGAGDPRVSEMQVTKTRINGELEKYFNGGTPTVSGLKEAQDELNAAQSPAQFKAAVKTITKLVAGQQSEYLNQINRGLGYLGTPKAITADDPLILSPEAQKARESVIARTQPNKADNSRLMDTGKEMLGAKPKQESASPSQVLNDAKNAIMKGAPRDKVIERLKSMGVDTTGL